MHIQRKITEKCACFGQNDYVHLKEFLKKKRYPKFSTPLRNEINHITEL